MTQEAGYLKSLIYKMIAASLAAMLVYFIFLWLLFDREVAMKVVSTIFVLSAIKFPAFIMLFRKRAKDEGHRALIMHLALDILIFLLPTAMLYGLPDVNRLYVSIVCTFLIVSGIGTFHLSLATVMYMVETGKYPEYEYETDPVLSVSSVLAILYMIAFVLDTALLWLLSDDVALSLIIALSMFTVLCIALGERARLIVYGTLRKIRIFQYCMATIVLGVAGAMLYFLRPDVIEQNLLVLFCYCGLYYACMIEKAEFFNPDQDSENKL